MSVYFIRAGADGPFIKIGTAIDPQSRLAELECASPFPLVLVRVIPGGIAVERWLHRHFSHLRVHREWFSFTPEMLDIEPPRLADRRGERRRSWALRRAIKAKGGPKALADAIGVTSQAISQWDRVPAERVISVEKATGVPRQELRPDLYPRDELANTGT